MKLRYRLSLYSLLIFSVVILIISTLVYFSFYTIMERKEIESLESKSLLAAIYYLEQDELSTKEHDLVKSQLQRTISRKNIAIFNEQDKQVNGDMEFPLFKNFLSEVRQNLKSYRITEEYFYNGIFYEDNEGDFVVITRGSKVAFNSQMNTLFWILIIVSAVGLLFIFAFIKWLGYIAYQPIVSIIDQIKNRNTSNFNQPLELRKTYAEVDDLILTYNQFIDQIAKVFSVQKNFIDYVSHELRTPIAALFGTLEVTHQKKRTVEEYEQVLKQLNQYTKDLQDTLDQMMLLSGAKTTFELKPVRIDEIIWQVIENAILYHDAHIDVDIAVSDDKLLKVNGNEKLLELAIGNIVGNAIKYSDNDIVKIVFVERNNHLAIDIIDKGIGVPKEDLHQIKQNFYRGENTHKYQGKGIGLSIANIVFNLHHIQLDITSRKEGGTVVSLVFNS